MTELEHASEQPESTGSGALWAVAVIVIAVGLVAGYALGMHDRRLGSIDNGSTDATGEVAAKAGLRPTPPREESVTVDTVRQVIVPVRVDTVYVADLEETEDPEKIVPSEPRYQTIVPPEEPPAYVPPPYPQLIEMLYGRRLLVSHTLFGDRIWTIEPGEITEFKVLGSWDDPARESLGVRVEFVAQANGAGIRASGLLRYYGDGTEGDGYRARDFLLEHIERFGRWQ